MSTFKRKYVYKDPITKKVLRTVVGDVWWFEFKVGGRLVRETSHSTNREVARRIERERRRDIELGIAGLKRDAPVYVEQAVEAFMDQNAARWGKRTLQLHKNSWRHLKSTFAKMLLGAIRPEQIGRYQSERRKAGVSGRTINIEVGLLRMVMIKHRVWSFIAPNVHMLREREDIGRSLSPDEEQRILAAAETSISRSLYPAVLLSLHTGVRSEELRMLRWKQIDFLKEEIRVGKSKTQGGEGRVIPLSATALQRLKNWKIEFPGAKADHFVFPTEKYKLNKKDAPGGSVQVYDCDPTKPIAGWKTAWRTARKTAKVSCRWHDLRHSFISRLGDNMVSDQTLMSMTGQLSRKTLERYSHARMAAKRAAVRMLDGPLEQNDCSGEEGKSEVSPPTSHPRETKDKEVIN